MSLPRPRTTFFTTTHLLPLILALLFLPLVSAQFGHFFDSMFGGSSGGGSGTGSGGGGQRHRGGGNVASDSAWYRGVFEKAPCDRYLCPGTLACVDKPTHCPCAWPDVEEKFELHEDGLAVCLSRSAVEGRTARKVELARKGLI